MEMDSIEDAEAVKNLSERMGNEDSHLHRALAFVLNELEKTKPKDGECNHKDDEKLDFGFIQIQKEKAIQEWSCECGAEGYDQYQMEVRMETIEGVKSK
jgi:hypothetical protein